MFRNKTEYQQGLLHVSLCVTIVPYIFPHLYRFLPGEKTPVEGYRTVKIVKVIHMEVGIVLHEIISPHFHLQENLIVVRIAVIPDDAVV